jgi:hypothetical protein
MGFLLRAGSHRYGDGLYYRRYIFPGRKETQRLFAINQQAAESLLLTLIGDGGRGAAKQEIEDRGVE